MLQMNQQTFEHFRSRLKAKKQFVEKSTIKSFFFCYCCCYNLICSVIKALCEHFHCKQRQSVKSQGQVGKFLCLAATSILLSTCSNMFNKAKSIKNTLFFIINTLLINVFIYKLKNIEKISSLEIISYIFSNEIEREMGKKKIFCSK